MELRFLVIEIEGDGLKDFKVVGRCRSVEIAYKTRDSLKKDYPLSIY